MGRPCSLKTAFVLLLSLLLESSESFSPRPSAIGSLMIRKGLFDGFGGDKAERERKERLKVRFLIAITVRNKDVEFH